MISMSCKKCSHCYYLQNEKEHENYGWKKKLWQQLQKVTGAFAWQFYLNPLKIFK